MDTQIRIVLAKYHPIIRSDLRLLLERHSRFRVTGEAASGREVSMLAEYRRPDIVLLDIKHPELNGIADARELAMKKPSLGLIFVTDAVDGEYVSEAFKAGARGYVQEDAAQADLIPAIQVVARGGSFLSPAISARLLDEFVTQDSDARSLSQYERELCCLIAAGHDEEDIASRLHATVNKVRADYVTISEALSCLEAPKVIIDSMLSNPFFGNQQQPPCIASHPRRL